jgi:hypothetical protein
VRLRPMEKSATNSPHGTVIDMESYTTSSIASAEDQIRPKTSSGPATTATASATPVRSSPLSEEEREKLARIRRNRNQGWMATFEEFDFLLTLVEALSR